MDIQLWEIMFKLLLGLLGPTPLQHVTYTVYSPTAVPERIYIVFARSCPPVVQRYDTTRPDSENKPTWEMLQPTHGKSIHRTLEDCAPLTRQEISTKHNKHNYWQLGWLGGLHPK